MFKRFIKKYIKFYTIQYRRFIIHNLLVKHSEDRLFKNLLILLRRVSRSRVPVEPVVELVGSFCELVFWDMKFSNEIFSLVVSICKLFACKKLYMSSGIILIPTLEWFHFFWLAADSADIVDFQNLAHTFFTNFEIYERFWVVNTWVHFETLLVILLDKVVDARFAEKVSTAKQLHRIHQNSETDRTRPFWFHWDTVHLWKT